MHHHQAESGMKEEKGWEREGVARRHVVTEKMKLVGNVKKMIKNTEVSVSIPMIL